MTKKKNSGEEPEALLTSEQVATWLGLKPQTLRNWRLTGKGPRYHRLGDSPKAPCAYRRSDVEAWLNERTYQHTAEEHAS
jgi:predicted DNA-binding transcriptional regulator AlpA